jgi:hypothetical protein
MGKLIGITDKNDLFLVVKGPNDEFNRMVRVEGKDYNPRLNGVNACEDEINAKLIQVIDENDVRSFEDWFSEVKMFGHTSVIVPDYILMMSCGCTRKEMNIGWKLVRDKDDYFHTLCKKVVD